ncbi:MAG: hypothetical protein ACNS60_20065 [Candidatus Cyclobacteriaceae bacterium M2_1C_046]
MTRVYIIFLLLIGPLALVGQDFPHEEWHRGRIVLSSGDTIAGNLKYNFESNVVQLNPLNSKELYVFSAQKLIYFDFIDKLSKAFRQFIILPYDIKNNNYQIPVFFEIIRQGPLTLLTRERIEVVNDNFGPYRSYARERLVYDYYFLKENGNIVFFDGKKRSLNIIFGKHTAAIKDFIKEGNLKLDKMADLARIVTFYNQAIN